MDPASSRVKSSRKTNTGQPQNLKIRKGKPPRGGGPENGTDRGELPFGYDWKEKKKGEKKKTWGKSLLGFEREAGTTKNHAR